MRGSKIGPVWKPGSLRAPLDEQCMPKGTFVNVAAGMRISFSERTIGLHHGSIKAPPPPTNRTLPRAGASSSPDPHHTDVVLTTSTAPVPTLAFLLVTCYCTL